jgi:signal transduction histidine kinase
MMDNNRTTQEVTGLSSDVLVTYYEKLIEISKQLNSTFDHAQLLRQIISAATELIDAEAASIMLIDPSSGELRFEASSNLDPQDMEKIVVPMEGSIAGWIATHGEPRVIHDVEDEPSHFRNVDSTIEFKTRNILGIPMRTHKRIIGVVQALNKRNNARFTDFDISILTILASQAAIAIENSRLFQQSDFIAEMVHELRTPLLSLKASTSLLTRPDLPPKKQHDLVNTMQSETDRLITLTSDFLDLAQMETGRTRLDTSEFDLSQLIHESVKIITPQANNQNIQLIVEGQPITVTADRGKIKQVLLNLLTNAIKYNRPNGQVRVYTSLYRDSIQIAVQDTGYGLSPENQKQIFQRFFRAKSTSEKTSGTGLGLVITKAIVEAHKGQIWLESQVDKGTTFFFTIPL